jgi:hypothetical protein
VELHFKQQPFRFAVGDVDIDLTHHLHDLGPYLAGGIGAR